MTSVMKFKADFSFTSGVNCESILYFNKYKNITISSSISSIIISIIIHIIIIISFFIISFIIISFIIISSSSSSIIIGSISSIIISSICSIIITNDAIFSVLQRPRFCRLQYRLGAPFVAYKS